LQTKTGSRLVNKEKNMELETMLNLLTYMVGGVTALAVVLMTILVFQIYDEDHPLNQDRPDEQTRID
jgi:hypothetical protein